MSVGVNVTCPHCGSRHYFGRFSELGPGIEVVTNCRGCGEIIAIDNLNGNEVPPAMAVWSRIMAPSR